MRRLLRAEEREVQRKRRVCVLCVFMWGGAIDTAPPLFRIAQIDGRDEVVGLIHSALPQLRARQRIAC